MPSRLSLGHRRRQAGGFTLIELIVVIAILGLALGLLTGFKPPWSRELGLRATAEEIASGLRATRSEAISQNRPVSFDIDLAAGLFKSGAGAPRKIQDGLRVELLTIAGERVGTKRAGIRFFPDGSSTGGRISIGDTGARMIAVGVDWLNGRVSVADIR